MALLIGRIMLLAILLSAPTVAADQRPVATQADVDAFFAFVGKLRDAAVDNKRSCPNMARALSSVLDANLELLQRLKGRKMPKAQGKEHGKAQRARAKALFDEIEAAMKPCERDKDIVAVLKRMLDLTRL